MKTATRLTFLLLACVALAAHGGERVDQRVDAPPDGTVSVENLAGSITVTGWDREEVRLEGELDDRVERLEFENDGSFTRIKVVYPRNMRGSVDGSELNISVPAGSRLEVSAVSSEVDVSGVTGIVRADTVSGDISVDAATNDYALESVSGNIRLDGTKPGARVKAATVSGDMRLGGIDGELDVTSISGRISADNGRYTRVEANNTSGEIGIGGEFTDEGVFRLRSISGDVVLRFATDPAGTFDVTTFSGGIENDFGPEPQRQGKYSPGMELKFRQDDSDAEFRLNTLSGDIELLKQ